MFNWTDFDGDGISMVWIEVKSTYDILLKERDTEFIEPWKYTAWG